MHNFNLRHNFNLIRSVLLILLIMNTSLLVGGCGTSNDSISKEGFFFDTIVQITVYNPIDVANAQNALDECMDLCRTYNDMLSRTDENSLLYIINHSPNVPTRVPAEFLDLLNESIKISQMSSHAVDPTIGALSDLWKIPSEDFTIPDDKDIQRALDLIGSDNILIDVQNQTVTLKKDGVLLDLGFISKGYIADRLKQKLIDFGITSALINLGGNILVVGSKNNIPKNPYIVGIKDPHNPEANVPLLKVKAGDYLGNHSSVVSSGDYERYCEVDGIRYHHILSTQDGYPIGTKNGHRDNNLSQVTIISKSSLQGDELSTLCFILGYDDSVDFLKLNYPDVCAIFVDKEGNITYYPNQESILLD